jgi:hypothetical protein
MKTLIISLGFLANSLIVLAQSHTLSATQYHPPRQGACTASGSRILVEKVKSGEHRWVALSRDMLKHYPFETVIQVKSKSHPELNGKWIVKDKMGARHKKCIDFLVCKGTSKLGRTKVEIYKL